MVRTPKKAKKLFFLVSAVFLFCMMAAQLALPTVTHAQSSAGYFLVDVNTINQKNASGETISNFEDGVSDGDWTYKEEVAKAGHNCKSMIAYQDGTPQKLDGTAHLWTNKWIADQQRCYFDFSDAHSDLDMLVIIQTTYTQLYGRKVGDPCYNSGGGIPPTCMTWDALRKIGNAHNDHQVITIKKESSSSDKFNFIWMGDGKIASIDKEETFTNKKSNPNVFFKSSEACADSITLNKDFSAGGSLGDDKPDGILNRDTCGKGDKSNVFLRVATEDDKRDVEQEKSGQGATGPSCESEGGVLAWVICPVLDLIDDGIKGIDQQIENLLVTPSGPFADDQGLHTAWATLRNVAYIILIPIMLVMVIGTALNFSFVDAYTVRRALPRMVIAIVFIALSWNICVLLIQITNELGAGIYGIMTSPFKDSIATSLADVLKTSGGIALGGTAIVSFAAAVVIFQGALVGILLLYAFSAFMAIIIGFVTLAIRQMLIIVLVMISALAILAWIFPGNDKLWKLWWNSFTKLLLMYPLIMAIIAAGRIFAGIAAQFQQGVLGIFLAITAYIAPYFLIPATFKFAGGLFANIAGVVNDRSRGIFDRSKKARQQIAADAHQRNMDGTSSQGKRVGGIYRRAASLGRNGSWDPTAQGRSRWSRQELQRQRRVAAKLNEDGGAEAWNDDDWASVGRFAGISRNDAIERYMYKFKLDENGEFGGWQTDENGNRIQRHSREDALNAINRSELATGAKLGSDAYAMSALQFRQSMTNTAYDAGPEGFAEMQKESKYALAHGLSTKYDLAGNLKANRGRPDYSTAAYGDTVDFVAGDQTAEEFLRVAARGADPREKIGGHQRGVETYAGIAKESVQRASANTEALQGALAAGSSSVVIQNVDDHGKLVDQTVDISQEANVEALRTQLRRDSDIATADLANVHSALSNVSSKKAQTWAEGSATSGPGALSMDVTYEVKVPVTVDVPGVPQYEPDGRTPVVRNGQPVWATPPRKETHYEWQTKTGSGRTLIEDTRHRVVNNDGSDGWYFDRVKEWSTTDEAQAGQRQAAEEARRAEEENRG